MLFPRNRSLSANANGPKNHIPKSIENIVRKGRLTYSGNIQKAVRTISGFANVRIHESPMLLYSRKIAHGVQKENAPTPIPRAKTRRSFMATVFSRTASISLAVDRLMRSLYFPTSREIFDDIFEHEVRFRISF